MRDEYVSVRIETECAHCGDPLHLTVDSDLTFSVEEKGARPLVFEPRVDWETFAEPNIIGAMFRVLPGCGFRKDRTQWVKLTVAKKHGRDVPVWVLDDATRARYVLKRCGEVIVIPGPTNEIQMALI